MSNISELAQVCDKLNISFGIINGDEAKKIISKIIKIFNPKQTTGHLSICNDHTKIFKISLEDNEFSYSKRLPKVKGYIFLI